MIILKITLLGPAHLHANPWARHVNEGLVEWPPSKVRLLRAVVSGTYSAYGRDESIDHDILEILGFSEIRYRIPPVTYGEHRTYHKHLDGGPQFVIDAFHALEPRRYNHFYVYWPDVELTPAQRDRLSGALAHLSYIGRSESSALWELVQHLPDDPELFDVCLRSRCTDGLSRQNVLLLDVMDRDAFEAEFGRLYSALTQKGRRRKKKSSDMDLLSAAKEDGSPGERLWKALSMTTSELHKQGLERPIGTTFKVFALPTDAVTGLKMPPRRFEDSWDIHYMRFSLSSPTPPHITESLHVGEALHGLFTFLASNDEHGFAKQAGLSEEQRRRLVFLVSGRGEGNVPHGHAYYIPEDTDGDGFIDHINVYVRNTGKESGLPRRFVAFVQRFGGWGPKLRWSEAGGGSEGVLTLVDYGEDAPEMPPRLVTGEASPYLGTAKVWKTHVPYLSTNHFKLKKGASVEDIERQVKKHILKELKGLGLAEMLEDDIEVRCSLRLNPEEKPRFGPGTLIAGTDFKTYRKRKKHLRPPLEALFSVTLRFRKPVRGPIALGFGAHMGLGILARSTS